MDDGREQALAEADMVVAPADNCETCKRWKVLRKYKGTRQGLMGICKLTDRNGPPIWVDSWDNDAKIITVKMHGCHEYQRRGMIYE